MMPVQRVRDGDARCRDCVFWEPPTDGGGGEGECRFFAPAPVASSGGRPKKPLRAAWPATAADEWCGEWRSRSAGTDRRRARRAAAEGRGAP